MTQQVNVRLPQPTINRLGELAELYGSQAKAIIAAIENLHTKEIQMKKQNYTINYNTGTGDKDYYGDLSGAMDEADSGAAYTQQPITITDERGEEMARRPWVGVLTGIEDQQNPIQFGDFGYYADWYEA